MKREEVNHGESPLAPMSTKRPKLQAYVKEELYERFRQWKESQGIGPDSEAVNRLLAEFFSLPPSRGDLLGESLLKILLSSHSNESLLREVSLLREKSSA